MTDYEKQHEEELYESENLDDQVKAIEDLVIASGLIESDGNARMIVGRLVRYGIYEGRKQAKDSFKKKLKEFIKNT